MIQYEEPTEKEVGEFLRELTEITKKHRIIISNPPEGGVILSKEKIVNGNYIVAEGSWLYWERAV